MSIAQIKGSGLPQDIGDKPRMLTLPPNLIICDHYSLFWESNDREKGAPNVALPCMSRLRPALDTSDMPKAA